MRISRLARIHDLSVQELTSYLDTIEPPLKSVHPNAKLDDATIDLIADHFGFKIEETPEIGAVEMTAEESIPDDSPNLMEESPEEIETIEEIKANSHPETPEEEIALLEGELAIEPTEEDEEAEEKTTEPQLDTAPMAEDEVILSDKLIEILESEDQPGDLDKIKLIKAPKKKLSGLKVLDKIEIPEDPRKKTKEQEEEEKGSRPQLSPEEKAERARKREEYKEKKRIEAKRKQEEYEARKEKRRREQEANRLRAERERHYQQQLAKQKTQATNKKSRKPQVISAEPELSEVETDKKPKTILGKFWRWLNT